MALSLICFLVAGLGMTLYVWSKQEQRKLEEERFREIVKEELRKKELPE